MPKRKKLAQRAAGILMPISSLPSPYGIGSFGKAAYAFVDFLREAGQRYWQVLPLSPTSYGDSPYQSPSAFAGNPYFIDFDLLKEKGLLKSGEIDAENWGIDPAKVDYNAVYKNREKILRKAFSRSAAKQELADFRAEHAHWLKDYAAFMAIKSAMNMRPWPEWPAPLRMRDTATLAEACEKLEADIDYHVFTQYMFFEQWCALKKYANENGVLIIGDIPIYVAMDSADSWSRSELFLLDDEKQPIDVAGCPPDAFSKDGQLWGNPLYRWEVLKADGYLWWLGRLHSCLEMYDVLRIDHFRGLESYYAIPYGNKNARIGEWREGPGQDFIEAINRELPEAEIIAEDLGFLTSAVHRLLKNSGYPGMKVMQFAFDSGETSDYMPHNYNKRCVVYTGTHDNDTSLGWFNSSRRKDVAVARRYLGIKRNAEGAEAMIRAAFSSVANLAVAPMQDWLGLDGTARMNTPSTLGGDNWRWRMADNAATQGLAEKIYLTTRLYGRLVNADSTRKG